MTPIEKAYQCGLTILDPSRRDLEHGLELHAGALVVDAYGFGPQATPRSDGLRALVNAGATPGEIQDFRENESLTRWSYDDDQAREARAAWQASGVNCVFVNAGEESNSVTTLLPRLAGRSHAADLAPDICRRAFQPDDIERAGVEQGRCYYMSANGVPLANRYEFPEDELRFIRTFFQLGVRMMHLTYNRANPIGDGCGEARNGGLTDFGRAVVARMNRVGVIVDVAHSGEQTSLEAARLSDRPVVASHTMCKALADHARGKSDDLMRAIADTGGYVGIVACASFLKRSFDLNAMLDHIQHAVETVGAAHVAIGSDVGYAPENEDPVAAANERQVKRRPWRSLAPVRSDSSVPDNWPEVKELSLRWTNFPLYTVGMVQRGFSDDDILRILGGNALRVARVLWDNRERP